MGLGLGMQDMLGWGCQGRHCCCCAGGVRLEVDWPQMFPGPMVPLALGLYIVTAWHGSLIDNGPGDVFAVDWGTEEHFLAWGGLWESISSMGLVELCALCLFAGEEVVSYSLHIHWLARSTRVHWNVLLCKISWGGGMLGLIGANLRSSRTSSRGFFAAWAVLSTVLMVLSLLLYKAIGHGEVRRGCVVLYVVVQEKLSKLLRQKGLAIVHWRAWMVAHTEIWAPAGVYIEPGQNLVVTLYRKEDTCWTSCIDE